jgi:hypothetical protein
MYDPYLNRWTQPDTIVSEPGSTQGLNRYSYVENNPILYSDPSGHCSLLAVPIIIAAIEVAILATPHFMGWLPDTRGVVKVAMNLNPDNAKIEVAAGLAVQSEWTSRINIWDDKSINEKIRPGASSGYGRAQASSADLNGQDE